jgi:hypothetical protein
MEKVRMTLLAAVVTLMDIGDWCEHYLGWCVATGIL